MKNLTVLLAISLLSGNVAFAKERYYHDDESHMKRIIMVDTPLVVAGAIFGVPGDAISRHLSQQLFDGGRGPGRNHPENWRLRPYSNKKAERKILRSIKIGKIGAIAGIASAAWIAADIAAFVGLEIYENYENKVSSRRTKNLTGSSREQLAEAKGSTAANTF